MEERDKRIRILILEEHGLLRTSLARLLSMEPDFEVVGECGSIGEALRILQASAIDNVLLDLGFGIDHARDFISAAQQGGYSGRLLFMTATADTSSAIVAFQLGACGVFLKSDPPERLVQAIRLIQTGTGWVDQQTIRILAAQSACSPFWSIRHQSIVRLDEREQKVLQGIFRGLTNKKIGDDLGLAESSVKNILQGIFGRTGVRTRSQLVRLAMEGSLGNSRPAAQKRKGKKTAPDGPQPENVVGARD